MVGAASLSPSLAPSQIRREAASRVVLPESKPPSNLELCSSSDLTEDCTVSQREEWEEAKFEAMVRALVDGSGSASSTIITLPPYPGERPPSPLPPPLFEAIKPSLDCPSYEEVAVNRAPGSPRPMPVLPTNHYRRRPLPLPPQMSDSRLNTDFGMPLPPARRPQHQQDTRPIVFNPTSTFRSKAPSAPSFESTTEVVPPSLYKYVHQLLVTPKLFMDDR